MRHPAVILAALAAVVLAGCAASTSTIGSASSGTSVSASVVDSPDPPASRRVRTASGLEYEDLEIGDGALAETGMEATVHYVGRFPDGRKFDSSRDAGEPYTFRLGRRAVIKGWDEGIPGMRVGGRRRLVVPPDLAYGATGFGNGAIPPHATLVFEVELLALR